MAAHENDDKIHLHMALIAVVKLQDANTKLQEANSEVSSCVAALKEVNYQLEENSQTLKKGAYFQYRIIGRRRCAMKHLPVHRSTPTLMDTVWRLKWMPMGPVLPRAHMCQYVLS